MLDIRRFRNFHIVFISRFFYFRIIREVLKALASIHVVGNFHGLKLGMQIVISQRSKALMHTLNRSYKWPPTLFVPVQK